MSALRAPENANPPNNMHVSMIFNGVFILSATLSVFVLRGHQRRREMDEQMRVLADNVAVVPQAGDAVALSEMNQTKT